ncbi:hypothetical protein GALL_532360 [mine drainage metagenome]|uniref:Uncharacterized protein n=1 Tax=mine drainage metagenome TaxID=410659 RepID=A0A1J5PBN6_9ZZZZ
MVRRPARHGGDQAGIKRAQSRGGAVQRGLGVLEEPGRDRGNFRDLLLHKGLGGHWRGSPVHVGICNSAAKS